MKNITEFILESSVDSFNKWLEDTFGYGDLYEYFSDSIPENISKSNCDKLAEDAYKNMHTEVKREAEEAGLDVYEICIRAYHQSV